MTSPVESVVRQAPRLSLEETRAVAARLFGLVGDVTPLPSERDQNVRVRSAEGRSFVLKIANAAESRATLEFQHAALVHLGRHPDVVTPAPIAGVDGEWLQQITTPSGTTHFVRALSYVEGDVLGDVSLQTPALHDSLGRRLATLDRALVGFDHSGARRPLPWDLRLAGAMRPYLSDVADAPRRAALTAFLDRFEAEVRPALETLRAQVVHNDWNDFNVLVASGPDGEPRVVTAIDYGDMIHAPLVCDVAIALAYALMGKARPWEVACRVVSGYHAVNPLTDEEVVSLPDLVRARLTMSVLMSAHQHRLRPDNDYLRVSEDGAWTLLGQLDRLPRQWLVARLRHACGLPLSEAAPRTSPDVAPWRFLFGTPPPALERLDAGIAAAALDRPSGATLPDAIEPAHGRIGVTAWAVARWCDDAERAVRDRAYDGPASVPLGVDIASDAPIPLHAVSDAVVHALGPPDAQGCVESILLGQRLAERDVFAVVRGRLTPSSACREGATIPAGDRLATAELGAHRAVVSLTVAPDLFGFGLDLPRAVHPDERRFWEAATVDAGVLIGLPAASSTPAADDLMARRRAHLGPSLSVSYRRPLTIVRGRGAYLFDADGLAYLDCVNNVAHVGHAHPRVVAAGVRQMRTLNTNTRYLHPHIVDYAEALTATLPSELSVCFFVCSGSEANDLALRLARAHTGRQGVVVVDGAYHGNLTSLVDISPYKFDGPGGRGRPAHVRVAAMPDVYRGRYRAPGHDLGSRYAVHVAEAVADLARAGMPVSAFVAESILSCGGQIVLPEGYLAAAYEAVRAAGGVCVADEVQVGFGRAGSHFWAFESQGVVPDIVTMGKPIGNGHPLGAVVTRPEIAQSFANGMEYFNTFGGNPVSCAIGLEVLRVVRDEGLQARALARGSRALEGFRALHSEFAGVGDVRGMGLFLGLELVTDRDQREPDAACAAYVAESMRALGVLVSTDGPDHNVLKIKPPMVFADEDVETLVDRLRLVLTEARRLGRTP